MRVPIVVFLNLDPVPGAFSDEESCREHIEDALKQVIPHYKPKAYVTGPFTKPKEDTLIKLVKIRKDREIRALASFSNVDA